MSQLTITDGVKPIARLNDREGFNFPEPSQHIKAKFFDEGDGTGHEGVLLLYRQGAGDDEYYFYAHLVRSGEVVPIQFSIEDGGFGLSYYAEHASAYPESERPR